MERWHKERKGKSEKKRIAGKVDFRVVQTCEGRRGRALRRAKKVG